MCRKIDEMKTVSCQAFREITEDSLLKTMLLLRKPQILLSSIFIPLLWHGQTIYYCPHQSCGKTELNLEQCLKRFFYDIKTRTFIRSA